MRIRRKIQLVYLVTLLPFLVLTVGLTYNWYRSSLKSIERDRINSARLVATAFTTTVNDMASAVRVVGLATVNNPPSSSTPERFTELNQDFPFYWSAISDQHGKITYASRADLVGKTIQDGAIGEAAGNHLTAIGNSRIYRGEVGFFVASAITNSAGTHKGLAIAYVDPKKLAFRLARSKILGGAHVVDSSGTLIVSFDLPSYGLTQPDWGRYAFVRQALAGLQSVDYNFTFPLTNRQRVVAAVPIKEFGWEAGSAIEPAIAFSSFDRSLALSLIVVGTVLGISAIAAALVSFSLLTSIDLLRLQAQRIGQGNGGQHLVKSGDELEEVSHALARTDKDLSGYIEGLEKMSAASQNMSASFSTQDAHEAIVQAARDLFSASGVVVFQHNPSSDLLEPTVWWTAIGAPPPASTVAPGEPIAGRVFSTRQMELITGPEEDSRPEWNEFRQRQPDQAFVAVPLEPGGRVIGTLIIAAPGVEKWARDGREMSLLMTFAGQVATLIENTRLYETERLVADILQQMLLSVPNQIDGLTFAVEYRSASHAARVGGDFYDIFEMRDGRVGIVIGDVAGKGLDASVMTSLVKNTVRAHADEPGKRPAEVVSLTSELMLRESGPEAFVTLFVAYLDIVSGDLIYCNAAHPTVALIRTDAPVTPLEATGSLVGALPDTVFEEGRTCMSPGSCLFMYTDGLTEARNPEGKFYGEKRLFQLLNTTTTSAPQDLIDEVLASVLEFTDNNLSDDMAMLALRLDDTDTAATPDSATAAAAPGSTTTSGARG